jgi:hypothetical protein
MDLYVMESALPLDDGLPVTHDGVDVPAALAAYRARTEALLGETEEGREKLLEYLDFLTVLEDMNDLVEARLGRG